MDQEWRSILDRIRLLKGRASIAGIHLPGQDELQRQEKMIQEIIRTHKEILDLMESIARKSSNPMTFG